MGGSDAADTRRVGKDYLAHYGVLGMKWGRRRSRAEIDAAKTTSADAQKSFEVRAQAKTGGTKTLSNEDLRKAVTRMRLEQEFAQLSAKEKEAAQSRGKRFVTKLFVDVGQQQARAVVNEVATQQRQQLMRKAMSK